MRAGTPHMARARICGRRRGRDGASGRVWARCAVHCRLWRLSNATGASGGRLRGGRLHRRSRRSNPLRSRVCCRTGSRRGARGESSLATRRVLLPARRTEWHAHTRRRPVSRPPFARITRRGVRFAQGAELSTKPRCAPRRGRVGDTRRELPGRLRSRRRVRSRRSRASCTRACASRIRNASLRSAARARSRPDSR